MALTGLEPAVWRGWLQADGKLPASVFQMLASRRLTSHPLKPLATRSHAVPAEAKFYNREALSLKNKTLSGSV